MTLLLCACSQDPFSKKDWYEIKAPSAFSVRNVGKTLVTRTQGTKVGACSIAAHKFAHLAWSHGLSRAAAPMLSNHMFNRLCCLQIASDGLKGRVFECNLADLQNVSWCHCWMQYFFAA